MDNRLKELHFPLTLDMDSWSDRAIITLASSWEQEIEKNWKKLLVAVGPVGVRGREFLIVLVALRKSKKRWGATDKNKERRKQRSKERRTKSLLVQQRRQQKWILGGARVLLREKGWWVTLVTLKNYLPPPSQTYIL